MRRKALTDLPENFQISDRVRKWAAQNNFGNLEKHLEYFLLKAEANGYRYVSWDAAFMTAIRDDWAKLRGKPQARQSIVEFGRSLGLEPRPGEEMPDYERRILAARH